MILAFADTSFYVALVNPRDSLRESALSQMRDWQGTIVTTEFVLIELGNWLCRTGDREVFRKTIERLREDAGTIIVQASSDLVNRGYELFVRRTDKQWSMTDCISFVVMNDYALPDALTADHHFEQAGFRVLLK